MKEVRVITVHQPYAYLISEGIKTVENRTYDFNDLMITMINLLVRFLALCFLS
jgi:hypothetical protein